MTQVYFIAWWNLENLFDTEDSPHRPQWLASRLKKHLKGWTAEILEQKLNNLASCIMQMNSESGPDILGVCEVENEHVLQKLVEKLVLPHRNYGIVHRDSKDKRGIDSAFIYDKNLFDSPDNLVFSLEVLKRNPTRDLLQAEFVTHKGNSLIIIANHWPARSGGQYESEPFRIMAAENLSYWLKRIAEERGNNQPVLVMGDFNDEPFNRSLTDYALSIATPEKMRYARKDLEGILTPYLHNLMWNEMADGKGTFLFNGKRNMLDQILVNRALALPNKNSNFDILSSGIYDHPMISRPGFYGGPQLFGAPSRTTKQRSGQYRSNRNSFWPSGYSDHFPVVVLIKES